MTVVDTGHERRARVPGCFGPSVNSRYELLQSVASCDQRQSHTIYSPVMQHYDEQSEECLGSRAGQ